MASKFHCGKVDGAVETTPLLDPQYCHANNSSSAGKIDDQGDSPPYSDYHVIDRLQDLVKDSRKHDVFTSRRGIRSKAAKVWDESQGWIVAFIIGLLTACVAAFVDVSVEVVADWKDGYCTANVLRNRRACCKSVADCHIWRPWTESYASTYAIYVGFSLVFGIIAGSLTMTTKRTLGTCATESQLQPSPTTEQNARAVKASGKTLYMAAGSGIPEIKTVLSGFDIPHLFDLKVLIVKAIGAIFAVATGMCLGKEGPFVHISACFGYLVATCFPKYANNQSKLREMISVACSAGLSVAFGAPIGGVLFSYEDISTYFPRRVLWRSCLCSVVAAAVLKQLNPTGTGKLVLFETNYGVNYDALHYLVFIVLGVCGGVFGGIFCRTNFLWSKTFRQLPFIKSHPVFELALVTLITALVQFPNVLIRDTGDVVVQRLLVDCTETRQDWICQQEAKFTGKDTYYAWLISGTFAKLFLTTITFGCKVPSGIIIPAMDAGALFGRLIGQLIPNISPGIFAMVGAAAFLAGVSRMTVSLAVIMFELTGEVNFIPPFIVAILTAKWVADAITPEGVYDLAQHLQGHPFLDGERAITKVQQLRSAEGTATVGLLLRATDVTDSVIVVASDGRVRRSVLQDKLVNLKRRGFTDSGLVLTNERRICQGFISQYSLEVLLHPDAGTNNVGESEFYVFDGALPSLFDKTPLTLPSNAPLEYAVELFGKLGISHLILTQDETGMVSGVVSIRELLHLLHQLG
ncbi:hypothetical protein FGRMN_5551 [Fusarium graminum]|nr:hypothetical protein FGRMN_5551 [Fusarium graminum]